LLTLLEPNCWLIQSELPFQLKPRSGQNRTILEISSKPYGRGDRYRVASIERPTPRPSRMMLPMPQPRLRVFYGPEEPCEQPARGSLANARNMVTVPLGEVLPLLADAVQSRRTWLRDFGDDDVTISSDLYEVLLAYRQLRRPSA
jgi:hypothetical protein